MQKIKYYILIVLLSLFCFISGYFSKRSEFYTFHIKPVFHKISYYFKNISVNPKTVSTLSIEISEKNLSEIEKNVKKSIRKKIISGKTKKYYNAKVNYNGKIFDAKIRIKGDWFDNINTPKWSLVVMLENSSEILGMKSFSIQDPITQGFLHEWVYQKLVGLLGCKNVEIGFINVRLNHKKKGIYLIQEQFESKYFSANQNDPFFLVKFQDKFLWNELNNRLLFYEKYPKFSTRIGYHTLFSSHLSPVPKEEVLSNSNLKEAFENINSKFNLFLNGKIQPQDLFDLNAMSKYLAITELLGGVHNHRGWKDRIFYANLKTGLLEPIGYDINTIWNLKNSGLNIELLDNTIGQAAPLLFPFYNDSLFMTLYLKEMYKYTGGYFKDSLFKPISSELRENYQLLLSEFTESEMMESEPGYVNSILIENLKYCSAILNPSKCIYSYIKEIHQDSISIGIINIQSLPVNLLGFGIKSETVDFIQKKYIPGMVPNNPLKYQYFKLKKPSKTDESYTTVFYSIPGSGKLEKAKILPWAYPDTSSQLYFYDEKNFIKITADTKYSEYFKIKEKEIWVASNFLSISDNLLIPEGYKVWVPSGTVFNLSNSATLLSYSPINFSGDVELPVFINQIDSTDCRFIFKDHFPYYTHFKNVIFNHPYVSSDSKSKEKTGFFSIECSPVSFSNCRFYIPCSAKLLTGIRSTVSFEDCYFPENNRWPVMEFFYSDGIFKGRKYSNPDSSSIISHKSRISLFN